MKICPYHLDALRSALAKRGVHSEDRFFQAQALILANAVTHDADFSIAHAHDHCPICTFIVPPWIDKAADSIAQEASPPGQPS